jgi:branched-chain amino acid transport system permease protein
MIEYLGQLFFLFGVNVILASSLNIINGFCGLFSMGHAGFYAIGAYISGAAALYWFPGLVESSPMIALLLCCLIAFLAAGIAGLIVGIPCLRLTGDYLAIATVGFGEIIRIIILNMDEVGASRGLPGIPRIAILPFSYLPWDNALANLIRSLVPSIGLAVLTVVLLKNFMSSSIGRAIIAIREDEIAARSMGINVRVYKTLTFVVGSSFAGLAGALFALNQQFLHPSTFNFMASVSALLMIVIGGLGSFSGAILGAFIVTALPEALRFVPGFSQARMLVFGLVMVLVMLWMPAGLVGLFKKKLNLDVASKKKAVASS